MLTGLVCPETPEQFSGECAAPKPDLV